MQHETTPNDNQVELLPCPFCGTPEPLTVANERMLPEHHSIICSGDICGAVTYGHTAARARLRWNRRASQLAGGDAVAWMANDGSGRVIDAKDKAAGERAKATGTAMAVYSTPLYTHPAADALGVVRELVAKWRAMAPLCKTLGYGEAMRENADVLESTLAQAPAVRVTGTHRYEESGRGWCKHCGYAEHVAEQHGAALGQGNGS